MARKRVKLKRKSKYKKEDKSKIVSNNDVFYNKEGLEGETEKCVSKKEKSSRQVHIAFLPEKYQPLVEDDTVDHPRDSNVKKKQDKYKKIRQNMGKAFRYTWKCLVVGLQNLSTGYQLPMGTVVPDIHRVRPHV